MITAGTVFPTYRCRTLLRRGDYPERMAESEPRPAKNRGRPPAGEERQPRKSKAVAAAEAGKPIGVGAQVLAVDRNLTIYEEWRSGVDALDIAREHDLGERRVRTIIDECRAVGIEGLGLHDRMAALRLGDDLTLRRFRSVSEAAKLIRKAEELGNLPVQLGAMKRRDEALTMLTEHLKDRGYLPRQLSALRGEHEWTMLVTSLFQVLTENGIEDVPGGVHDQLSEALGLRGSAADVDADVIDGELV